MTIVRQSGPSSRVKLAGLLLVPALLLGGCSSRDAVLSEKLAAADAAAQRAEAAANRADAAANKAESKVAAPAAVEVEAEPDDLQDPNQNQDPAQNTATVRPA